MKKLGTLLISFSLIFLIGCSTDSNNDPPAQSGFDLTGSWIMSSYSYFGSRTDIFVEDVVQYQFTGIGWEINMLMEFMESPNNYTSVGSYFVDHIVTNQDGQEFLYYGYFDKNDQGTWSRIHNDVLLTLEGETNQGYISELTDDNLELIIESSSQETATDGTVTNITRTDIYNFIKE